jgi:hypothetical protein
MFLMGCALGRLTTDLIVAIVCLHAVRNYSGDLRTAEIGFQGQFAQQQS